MIWLGEERVAGSKARIQKSGESEWGWTNASGAIYVKNRCKFVVATLQISLDTQLCSIVACAFSGPKVCSPPDEFLYPSDGLCFQLL